MITTIPTPTNTAIDPKIRQLLDAMMNPGVQFNLQDMKLWGVLFHKTGPDEWTAITASGLYIIAARNIGFTPPGIFYSYAEKSFLDISPYPRTAEQLLEQLYSGFNVHDKTQVYTTHLGFQIPNVVNLLETMGDKDRKQSRVIIAPTPSLRRLEYVGRFDGNHQLGRVFKSPKVDKPFIARDGMHSNLVHPDVKYRFVATAEYPDHFSVEITGPHSPARIGVVTSPNGFIPEDIDAINRFETTFPSRMKGIPIVNGDQNFVPHHFDANLFHILMRACLISGADLIDLALTTNLNAPVFLSTDNRPENPHLDIMIATLDWQKGPQRR